MSIYGFCENKCKHELDDVLNNALIFKGEVFKNVDWDSLEIGFYNINTFSGEGGKNYPADNLFGSLIVLGRAQIAITGTGIYRRTHNDSGWLAWNLMS